MIGPDVTKSVTPEQVIEQDEQELPEVLQKSIKASLYGSNSFGDTNLNGSLFHLIVLCTSTILQTLPQLPPMPDQRVHS